MTGPFTGTCAAVLTVFALTGAADAASYIFSGRQNGLDLVAHPTGYVGTGGNVRVTVGIDQTSVFQSDIAVSVQNAVNTFNAMLPTLDNFSFGAIAANQIDFESVLLHEIGHSIGLAHYNLASESSLPASQQHGTRSTNGDDRTYNVSAGADGVFGTADDIRGDDDNLVYFNTATNDPFDTNLGTVDGTTYLRDVTDLPGGNLFPAIATREAAALMGYGNTEAVMVQGTFFGEVQRALAAQDVAGMLYAQAGADGIAGTLDDYTLTLDFIGAVTAADILIDFDNGETGFAVSNSGGVFIDAAQTHATITSSSIFFNDGFNWFFNRQSNAAPVPLPASLWGLGLGLAGFAVMKRRARKSPGIS
jgi:hypothetical protein